MLDARKIALALSGLMLATILMTLPAKSEGPTFYGGVFIGANMVDNELAVAPFSIDGLGAKGKIAGIHGGVDFAVPNTQLFVGPFARYTFSDAEFAVNPGLFSAKYKDSYSVGGRAGVKVGDAKPYIALSHTWLDLDWSTIVPIPAAPDLKGWTLGLGIDVPIKTSGIVLGIEGSYTMFKEAAVAGTPITLQADSLEIMARLSFAFGGSALGIK